MTVAAGVVTILCAEDDPDDRMLLADALESIGLPYQLHFTEDGEQLMSYLRREGDYVDSREFPSPDLLLLDLNMPRMDGREALVLIRADPSLRELPVVVMSTADSDEDVRNAYGLGASSFVTKPVTFERLVKVMQDIRHYWTDVATLPRSDRW